MRAIGTLHPTDQVPVPPDTVTTFLMTGGSSAQAADWLSSGSTITANAAVAGVGVVRITPITTAGGAFFCMANLLSTQAAVPTSGTSISTGASHPVMSPSAFQVPGGSTGFSIAAITSGIVIIEQWRK